MCLGLANGYKEPKEMTPQKAIKILNETIVIIDEKCKTTPKEYHKMLVMAEKALEKQIPKKVKEYRKDGYYCPICKAIVYPKSHYCNYCGQALDWSDIK